MALRTVTCYAILLATTACANLFGKNPEFTPTQIDETLRLYLAADQGYHPGDLLTRSQLAEFQTYLRTTQGTQLATKPRWLNRTLPDSAPLVRVFQRGGNAVLRTAAVKLGGYAELDVLARTGEGRKVIQRAIQEKSSDSLVGWVLEKRQAVAAKQPGTVRRDQRARTRRIYTATEYLAAVSDALQEPPAAERQPPPSVGVH